MTVLAFPVRPRASIPPDGGPDRLLCTRSLGRLLGLGDAATDLPPLPDLVLALLALADASRKKALLPVVGLPLEIALVRRGASVLVSAYHTDAAPEVVTLDRRVPLRALLDAAAEALRVDASAAADMPAGAVERLCARAAEASIVDVGDDGASAVHRRGGADADPGEDQPLAFGFEIAVFPSPVEASGRVWHADVHAMLFGGQIWAWARGRRIPVMRGPALLAVQRMVAATSAILEAAEQNRAANIRLRAGSFVVGMRRDKPGSIALSIGSDDDGVVTVPALSLEEACLPILRLGSEMLRALSALDRPQARNLRVRSLRAELRRLSRLLRTRARATGFVNADPERLRASAPPPEELASATPSRAAARWTSRWSLALDGLDAEQCLSCGPLLLCGGERGLLSIDRDEGRVVWRAEEPTLATYVAGTTVLALGTDGALAAHEMESGETLFRTRMAPRTGGPPLGLVALGSSLVPTAILAEGSDRLVALDLRTGEPRWRFSARGHGAFRLRRAGRALLTTSGDTSLVALDLLSGEIAWRFVDDLRFTTSPVVSGDTVVALTGEPGRGAAEIVGLDLYEGRVRFRTSLEDVAACAPVVAGDVVLVPTQSGRRARLVALEARTGVVRWTIADPGMALGAGVLSFDDRLVVSTPGHTTLLDLTTGEVVWQHASGTSRGDDVPRRLDPILRGGAIITRGSSVEVLRASDGTAIGGALLCDLVPDVLLADERGWIYVGEESGHLVALAPMPRLSLVR